MKRLFLFMLLALVVTACEEESDMSNVSDEAKRDYLTTLHAEILSLAQSEVCTDGGDWNYVGIGFKPCGGYSHYLAYHKDVDKETLIDKVNSYTLLEKEFVIGQGLISDCAIVSVPQGVTCEEEKPVLVY